MWLVEIHVPNLNLPWDEILQNCYSWKDSSFLLSRIFLKVLSLRPSPQYATPECRLCPWIVHTPLLVQVYLATSVFTEPDEEIWHKLSYIFILITKIRNTLSKFSHFMSFFSLFTWCSFFSNYFHMMYCAGIYKSGFCENKPKTLVFNGWKRSLWACFRENWVYKFGQWIQHCLTASNQIPLYFKGCWDQTHDCWRVCMDVQKNVMPNFISYLTY